MKGLALKFSTLVLLSSMLGSYAALAQDIKLEVTLSKMERVKATEEQGDELYFSILEYSSAERPRHYVVPDFPTHWLSQYLSKVTKVPLWDKVLKENESASIIFALIERDAPPWNVDDLVGTVKLKVLNNKGKLEQKWSVPNKEDTQPLEEGKNAYRLTGDNGDYHVFFDLKKVQ